MLGSAHRRAALRALGGPRGIGRGRPGKAFRCIGVPAGRLVHGCHKEQGPGRVSAAELLDGFATPDRLVVAAEACKRVGHVHQGLCGILAAASALCCRLVLPDRLVVAAEACKRVGHTGQGLCGILAAAALRDDPVVPDRLVVAAEACKRVGQATPDALIAAADRQGGGKARCRLFVAARPLLGSAHRRAALRALGGPRGIGRGRPGKAFRCIGVPAGRLVHGCHKEQGPGRVSAAELLDGFATPDRLVVAAEACKRVGKAEQGVWIIAAAGGQGGGKARCRLFVAARPLLGSAHRRAALRALFAIPRAGQDLQLEAPADAPAVAGYGEHADAFADPIDALGPQVGAAGAALETVRSAERLGRRGVLTESHARCGRAEQGALRVRPARCRGHLVLRKCPVVHLLRFP